MSKLQDAVKTLCLAASNAEPMDEDDPSSEEVASAIALVEGVFSAETDLLDLTDEQAGRWLKHFAAGWKTESQELIDAGVTTPMALRMMSMLEMVQGCISMNAGEVTYDLKEVIIEGNPAGDWRIIVQCLKEDGTVDIDADYDDGFRATDADDRPPNPDDEPAPENPNGPGARAGWGMAALVDAQREETLDEFVARLKVEADEFCSMWQSNNRDKPEEWPMSMPPGDWDEQFRADMGG